MNPIGFGIFAGALLFGGGLTVDRFQSDAARGVQSQLGGQAHVAVSTALSFEAFRGVLESAKVTATDFKAEGLPMHVEPGYSHYGHIRRLSLRMERFELSGLSVDRMTAAIPDCRFDMGYALAHHKLRLTQSGTGTAEVEVSEAALERYALKKFKLLKELHVKIEGGQIRLSGVAELLVRAPFEVTGTLMPANGSQIVLNPTSITINGKPADPAMAQGLLSRFNPIIDLNKELKMEGAVELQEIELKEGEMIGRGRVRIPDE